ncbi:hypothetical protein [Streptomyces cathayae]
MTSGRKWLEIRLKAARNLWAASLERKTFIVLRTLLLDSVMR